jgi:hypothetical protein
MMRSSQILRYLATGYGTVSRVRTLPYSLIRYIIELMSIRYLMANFPILQIGGILPSVFCCMLLGVGSNQLLLGGLLFTGLRMF